MANPNSQEDVNETWAGLGYYRRARYLLDGAKYVVERLDGEMPETAGDLKGIPGDVPPHSLSRTDANARAVARGLSDSTEPKEIKAEEKAWERLGE